MKKIKIEKFVAADGREFDVEGDCVAYEEALARAERHTSYFRVAFNPDLNEGRGYHGVALVEVYADAYVDRGLLLRDFLVRNVGRELRFVQNCSPIDGWVVTRFDDRESWLAAAPVGRIGDYSVTGKRCRLIMGRETTGLVVDNDAYDGVFDD